MNQTTKQQYTSTIIYSLTTNMMKKLFFIAAVAGVALASCTKNEPAPSVDAQQEITFMTAPLTKANEFSTSNVFESWAFYTPTDWATDHSTTAVAYGNLADKLIKWDTTKNKWWNVDGEVFYWPKAGKLTFFSYSLNSTNTDDGVKCSTDKGIYVEDYNVNTKKDVDFLVADIATDKTANESYASLNGVPTLFRHKLSNVVFTIQTTDDYTATKAFALQSITLKNIAVEADYQQLGTEGWSNYGADAASTTFSSAVTTFTKAVATPTAEQSLYMPQTFDADAVVEIVYKVTSGSAVETVTVDKKLSDLFATGWEMGKKYTCAIKVSLNEILWAPAVEDWTAVTGGDFAIN